MKKLFILALSLLLIANSGCGLPTETQKAQGNVRVRIPIREGETPIFKTVELKEITDLRRVSGGIAHFLLSPKIEKNQMYGERPLGRFVKSSEGVFIPADSSTAELAAIYYHLQNLFAYDEELGIGSFKQGPRRVAVSTLMGRKDEVIRNNSFYDPNSDAMIFVDYTGDDLPLALNSGVIAHEHFHSIFSKILLMPLVKAKKVEENLKVFSHESGLFGDLLGAPQLAVSLSQSSLERDFATALNDYVLLKALNEGLADYWGWLYSKDENFVKVSIPGEETRSLKSPAVGFDSPEGRSQKFGDLADFYEKAEDKTKTAQQIQDVLSVYAYGLGNQYARLFRSLSKNEKDEKFSAEQQKEMAKSIILMLNSLRENILLEGTKDHLEPEKVIRKFADLNSDIEKKNCRQFKNLFPDSFTCEGRER